MMKRIMVRYRVKPDQAGENQRYVEQVFAELQRTAPAGIRYATFKEPDGVSFVHIASIETENGDNPLSKSPAFQAFQAGIRDRCEVQPVATELDEVGSYRVFEG
jgi:hypothetical protein